MAKETARIYDRQLGSDSHTQGQIWLAAQAGRQHRVTAIIKSYSVRKNIILSGGQDDPGNNYSEENNTGILTIMLAICIIFAV